MDTHASPDVVSLRILLVDHDVQILELLQSLLEYYGHEVRTAVSCEEALALASELRPQVIFTGIALLRSSGFELVKSLRERPECTDTMIVALTGHESLLDLDFWKESGFDRIVRKPAKIEVIVEVLQDVAASQTINVRTAI